MRSESAHVPLDALWQYHTTKIPLTTEQLAHAVNCRHCICVLDICMMHSSFELAHAVAEKMLSKRSLDVEPVELFE